MTDGKFVEEGASGSVCTSGELSTTPSSTGVTDGVMVEEGAPGRLTNIQIQQDVASCTLLFGVE